MTASHEPAQQAARGSLHHVELWVPDLGRAVANFGWLLECLGYRSYQNWDHGRSWRLGDTYIVIEESPALTAGTHDRLRPGLNHLAFHAGPPASVDHLVTQAVERGWSLLFLDKHPYAGGPQHYAAYLSDPDGFEVELVAQDIA
jgi:catechol 2,3-dioxygenase-like lactoylglutathione lyase family enzyme